VALNKKSRSILEHVQKILKEYDFRLSLRQIYYQLVARQVITNCEASYKMLSRLCTIGRDEGLLSEDCFTDRLRIVDKPSMWTDLADFIHVVKTTYRRDPWFDQENYVEIWSEKDALRTVFYTITYGYGVPLLIVRGQVSRTAIYEAHNRFSEKIKNGKMCYLFYFGDFDPSGLAIYNSLVKRLRDFGDCGRHIIFERIALTGDQIDQYKLPQDPAKKTDPNYRRFVLEYGDNVVELDALPPDALMQMIRDAIKDLIDYAAWVRSSEMELKEKETIQNIECRLSE